MGLRLGKMSTKLCTADRSDTGAGGGLLASRGLRTIKAAQPDPPTNRGLKKFRWAPQQDLWGASLVRCQATRGSALGSKALRLSESLARRMRNTLGSRQNIKIADCGRCQSICPFFKNPSKCRQVKKNVLKIRRNPGRQGNL